MRPAGLLGLLFAGCAVAAAPEVNLTPIFAQRATPEELARITAPAARSLAGAKAVRGKFVQRRYLAGLAKPLESSGTFLFAREAGIEWRTQKPFDSQFLLTESRIRQRDEGGDSLEISAADQPALAVVARVFFALFALDVDSLSHDFELYGRDSGNAGWELGLKPRAEALGSVFRHAQVRGGSAVRTVTLEDGNGDRSEIEFSDVVFDPKGLTAEERRRF